MTEMSDKKVATPLEAEEDIPEADIEVVMADVVAIEEATTMINKTKTPIKIPIEAVEEEDHTVVVEAELKAIMYTDPRILQQVLNSNRPKVQLRKYKKLHFKTTLPRKSTISLLEKKATDSEESPESHIILMIDTVVLVEAEK